MTNKKLRKRILKTLDKKFNLLLSYAYAADIGGTLLFKAWNNRMIPHVSGNQHALHYVAEYTLGYRSAQDVIAQYPVSKKSKKKYLDKLFGALETRYDIEHANRGDGQLGAYEYGYYTVVGALMQELDSE